MTGTDRRVLAEVDRDGSRLGRPVVNETAVVSVRSPAVEDEPPASIPPWECRLITPGINRQFDASIVRSTGAS
jgi:hypothetical protein